MIKTIYTSGRYIQVMGSEAHTYLNHYAGAQGIGNMRFNTTSQNFEVFDGNGWCTIAMSNANIGLSGIAEEAIDWVRKQMEEEKRLTALAEDHPAVKAALENLNRAKEQLKITAHLSRDYEETTS